MTESRYECPLCGIKDDRTKIYRHLQTSHRKSELSRTLLDERYDGPDWVGAKYCEAGQAD